jgi:hypothetical protein
MVAAEVRVKPEVTQRLIEFLTVVVMKRVLSAIVEKRHQPPNRPGGRVERDRAVDAGGGRGIAAGPLLMAPPPPLVDSVKLPESVLLNEWSGCP